VTYYADDAVTLYHGDCIEVMRGMADASVDAIVTDPPYGLEFMGKEWDAPWKLSGDVVDDPASLGGYQDPGGGNGYTRSRIRFGMGDMPGFQSWCTEWATEALRVLKPGGHLLAFGGTRTWHRLACAIEDAGFEIRDSIAWMYGSGFPKSLDVSKAIDKMDAGDERLARARAFQSWLRQYLTPQQVNDATGTDMGHHLTTHPTQPSVATADLFDTLRPMLPAVPAEIEHLVAQRTVESQNFKARVVVGTARMVDTKKSRLGFAGETYGGTGANHDVDLTVAHTSDAATWHGWGTALKPAFEPIVVARKPLNGTVAANVLAHGTGALNIDGCRIEGDVPSVPQPVFGVADGVTDFGAGVGRNGEMSQASGRWPANVILDESQARALDAMSGDRPGSSTASKTSLGSGEKSETHGWGGTIVSQYADTGGASRFFYTAKANNHERPRIDGSAHPTVKPLDLMRYLVRLVTPPGGTVLEPFAGSGTTAEACIVEGFKCIAIEREAEYLPLIVQRISKPIQVTLL
jgi:DNA modification methylase